MGSELEILRDFWSRICDASFHEDNNKVALETSDAVAKTWEQLRHVNPSLAKKAEGPMRA